MTGSVKTILGALVLALVFILVVSIGSVPGIGDAVSTEFAPVADEETFTPVPTNTEVPTATHEPTSTLEPTVTITPTVDPCSQVVVFQMSKDAGKLLEAVRTVLLNNPEAQTVIYDIDDICTLPSGAFVVELLYQDGTPRNKILYVEPDDCRLAGDRECDGAITVWWNDINYKDGTPVNLIPWYYVSFTPDISFPYLETVPLGSSILYPIRISLEDIGSFRAVGLSRLDFIGTYRE